MDVFGPAMQRSCPLFGGSSSNNREGTSKCVLYREVFPYCVLYSECPVTEVLLHTELDSITIMSVVLHLCTNIPPIL